MIFFLSFSFQSSFIFCSILHFIIAVIWCSWQRLYTDGCHDLAFFHKYIYIYIRKAWNVQNINMYNITLCAACCLLLLLIVTKWDYWNSNRKIPREQLTCDLSIQFAHSTIYTHTHYCNIILYEKNCLMHAMHALCIAIYSHGTIDEYSPATNN